MSEIPFHPITSSPIDISGILSIAHNAKAGGLVLFSGEVRNHQDGLEVKFLEYEVHEEMATNSIVGIVEDAKKKWSLEVAFAQHRIGKVPVSECAVIVITSAAHRKEAYEANQYIIDRIKAETPIWKKEHFFSGEETWR